MEKVRTIILIIPILLTLYLSFFQTQNLWLKKNYLRYAVVSMVFGVIWFFLPVPFNFKKLFSAPIAWVLSCYIGQLIHNYFAKSENKTKPIVFVIYDTVIGKEFYNKFLNQKPTFLDLILSAVAVVGPILILILFSDWINKVFD